MIHLIIKNEIQSLQDLNLYNENLNYRNNCGDLIIDNELTPLLVAVFLGKNEIIKLLLENETIDVNMESFDSLYTPLNISCLNGNYEILSLLLESGAYTNKPDFLNRTPLMNCFCRLDEKENKFENSKICFKMSIMLLNYGADINWIVDLKRGYNILMYFIEASYSSINKIKNNLEIIKFLIEHGANKNSESFSGENPYSLAKKLNYNGELYNLLKNTHQIYFYGGLQKNVLPPVSPTLYQFQQIMAIKKIKKKNQGEENKKMNDKPKSNHRKNMSCIGKFLSCGNKKNKNK